jgi:hypothetical protein
MAMRNSRKDFPSMKEFGEGFEQWLIDRQWSLNINWMDQKHHACKHSPSGNWKLQGYGHYEAADYTWRNYASFRCTKCGIMVQFNQVFSDDDQAKQPVQRLVIVP